MALFIGEERHTASTPWGTLVGCLFASTMCGFFYSFSVYSGALKAQFGMTQSQVESINTLPYLLGPLSFIPGIFVQRVGPRRVLALGGSMVSLTACCQWAVARRVLAVPVQSVPLVLTFLAMLTYAGMQCVTSVVFPLPAQHFPHHRGAMVGIAKCFVGLAAGIILQAYVTITGRQPDSSDATVDFILFYAILSVAVTLAASATVRAAPREAKFGASSQSVRLRVRAIIALILGIIVLMAVVSVAPIGMAAHRLIVVFVLGLCLALALLPLDWPCLPGDVPVETSASDGQQVDVSSAAAETASRATPATAAATRAAATAAASPTDSPAAAASDLREPLDFAASVTRRHELADLDAVETIQTLNCWLLLLSSTAVIGGGAMLTTNLNQIVVAVQSGSDGALVSSAVTLFSCSQSLSRLAVSTISDSVLRRGYAVPRPLFVTLVATFMGIGHLLFFVAGANSSSTYLLMGCCLCGVGFGGVWPLMVVISSELFGSRRLSQNYMIFDGTGGAVGNVVLANLLPSVVYSRAPHFGQ
ncbi:unnamed protein product, partial [Polarella glacialis]